MGAQTPEQLRDEAVKHGRLADTALLHRQFAEARDHIAKARELTLQALQIDQAQNNQPG